MSGNWSLLGHVYINEAQLIDLRGDLAYTVSSCSVNSAKIFHIFSSSYQLEDIQRNIPIKKWYPCQDSTGKTLSVVFCTQVSLNNCRQISKWIYSFKNLFKILKRANLICSLAMWSSRQIDNFLEYCQIVRYWSFKHSGAWFCAYYFC